MGFFSDAYWGKLVVLLKVYFTVLCPSLTPWLGPLESLTLKVVSTEPAAVCPLQSRLSFLALVPAVDSATESPVSRASLYSPVCLSNSGDSSLPWVRPFLKDPRILVNFSFSFYLLSGQNDNFQASYRWNQKPEVLVYFLDNVRFAKPVSLATLTWSPPSITRDSKFRRIVLFKLSLVQKDKLRHIKAFMNLFKQKLINVNPSASSLTDRKELWGPVQRE